MFKNMLLPGIVGEIGESNGEYYIWTHKKLDIGYNDDQIVDVTLTSESKAKLTPGAKISFTYEVSNNFCFYKNDAGHVHLS